MWFWETPENYEEEAELEETSTREDLDGLKDEITEQEADKLKQKSIEIVWKKEVDLFIEVYRKFLDKNLTFSIDFVKEVKQFQFENDLPETWIIDKEMLAKIRENIYNSSYEISQYINSKETAKIIHSEPPIIDDQNIPDKQEFERFLDDRKNTIANDMANYRWRKYKFMNDDETFRFVEPLLSNFNPTSKKTFDWGYTKWVDINNPFIANKLVWFDFNDEIEKWEDKNNRIVISKVGWQVILRLYINNVLHLASPVSPWDLKHKTPSWIFRPSRSSDKYHISSEFPERNWLKWWWAVMPNAIHITNWIWIHGSADTINWRPQSHWCIRSFLYYQDELFKRTQELGLWNYTIKIWRIY